MQQEKNLFTPDCIRTFSGQYVKVVDPDPATLLIEDVAHSLANQYRFGGHLPVQYTVAQHCVMCARFTKGDKFEALMHEAAETFLGDMPSPIKKHLPDYQALEHKLMVIMSAKFGFPYPFSQATKNVDLQMLQWEWEVFMLQTESSTVEVWGSDRAKAEFLSAYHALKPEAL